MFLILLFLLVFNSTRVSFLLHQTKLWNHLYHPFYQFLQRCLYIS